MTLTETVTRLAARPRRRSLGLGLIPYAAALVDLGVVIGVTLLAVAGREDFFFDDSADLSGTVGMAAPGIALGWLSLIWLLGGYKRDVFGAGTDELKRVLNASLLTAGLVSFACYLAQFPLSRGFFLLLVVLGIPALAVGRLALRTLLHRARRNGALLQGVLIVGSAGHVDEVSTVLRRERWLGYRVTGALTPSLDRRAETPTGVPVLGDTDDVAAMRDSDVIFFAGGTELSATGMRRIVWELEAHDVQMVVAPSVSETSSDRVRVRPVGGLPLMHLDPPTWSEAARIGKRTFDILGSLTVLVLMWPLFLVAALGILVQDGGPLLFRQTRIGRHGVPFVCLKFRTMEVDAEARLAELHLVNGHSAGLFKLPDDPRVTRSGRWLRRYSIDELPQLVNVLRGDMSLVGPRPPLALEVDAYGDDIFRRLHVRPGLTGLWQVSGRSDLSWEDAVRLDLYYVDNWSMLQDFSILVKTLGAVLRSDGAY